MNARLRLEIHALLELYLIPSLCALMPWWLGFRWLRFCSRFRRLFGAEWQAALVQARQFVQIDDEALWARQFRLCRLVDHADMYISMTRSNRWLKTYVDDWDQWPDIPEKAVGLTFHWCPGIWATRALRQRGATVGAISAAPNRVAMGGALLGYWYARLRVREAERISGHPMMLPEGAVRRSVRMLGSDAPEQVGFWVCGFLDVPPGPRDPSEPVEIFGRQGQFPTGLIGIARLAKVPVVLITCGLDLRTGRRRLQVWEPRAGDDPKLLQDMVDVWRSLISEHSWGYFLWLVMPAWMR